MIDFATIVNGRTVDVYDGTASLGRAIHAAQARRVTVFDRNGTDTGVSGGVAVRPYDALLEAVDCVASVCVLNNAAVKIMVAMYPSLPKYVLIRLSFNSAWILGFFGLLRRVVFGLVRIDGITKLPNYDGAGYTYWLVIEQSEGAVHSIPVLPKAIGIPAFLKWLRDENISYVVLRFFEKLPELHREAGDLDLLVADEDKPKVEKYLNDNEHLAEEDAGDIRIGMHSVSGEKGALPYYPPLLAAAMLDRAIEGPAGSRIPEPTDALNSLIYHTLYHSKKGYASGIPSSLDAFIDTHPENDYLGEIQRMADVLGVEVGNSMEKLDEYMADVGWRPKLDTLAKMSWTNSWVRDRFFAPGTGVESNGLAVFILRQWMVDRGHVADALEYIANQGYVVLRHKLLSDEEQHRAFVELRGGTWGANESGDTTDWMPAYAIVVIDTQCARMPASYSDGLERYRIRQLKELMRARYDTNGMSSMHSTDTTHEAWEYIDICFTEDVSMLHDEVARYASESRLSDWLHTLSPRYLKHALKRIVRRFFITHFLG